jgi:hypothetical protein
MFHPDPDPDELPLVALADGAAVVVSGCVPVPDPTGLLFARTPRDEGEKKELHTKETHHRKRTASRKLVAERDGDEERIIFTKQF